MFMLITVGV